MKVVTFLHSAAGSAGTLGRVIEDSGAEHRTIYTYLDNPVDFDPYAPDLLVVMGGSPGAYQDDIYPFLKTEIKILEKRLAADLPTLGICLGSQLMAAALGARVYKGTNGVEMGWFPIKVTEAGQHTSVRHMDGELTNMAHWHQDTFDLPAGATLLASSEKYENQAYSWGKNALALQCHPEMTPDILKHWYVTAADRAAAGEIDLPLLYEQEGTYAPGLMRQTEKFMQEWLGHVMAQVHDRIQDRQKEEKHA